MAVCSNSARRSRSAMAAPCWPAAPTFASRSGRSPPEPRAAALRLPISVPGLRSAARRAPRAQSRGGGAASLALRDAERRRARAEADLADADQRLANSQADLFRALGGGWQSAQLAPPPLAQAR